MDTYITIATFDGAGSRKYEVRLDRKGWYVMRVDDNKFEMVVNPDHMLADENFETESAAYFYAMGCADGDRRA